MRGILLTIAAAVSLAAAQLGPATQATGPTQRLYVPIAAGGAGRIVPSPSPRPLPSPIPTATPPSWSRSDVVLVFLAGLHTTSSDTGFAPLEAALAAAGWSYGQFVHYSYRGGQWSGQYWQPAAYDCGDSLEGMSLAGAQLAATLEALSARLPRARYVLVGHSFGGLVALAHASSTPAAAVVGVLTVDAPLYGVGPGKSALYDLWPCGLAAARSSAALTVAMADLEAIHANTSAWDAYWRGQLGRLSLTGRLILTIGNQLDCTYWPSRPGCVLPSPFDLLTFSDDRPTQYVPGYVGQCDADAASWSATHGAMLRDPTCLAGLVGRIEAAATPR